MQLCRMRQQKPIQILYFTGKIFFLCLVICLECMYLCTRFLKRQVFLGGKTKKINDFNRIEKRTYAYY